MEHRSKRFTALLLSILLVTAGCQPLTSSNPPTGNVGGVLLGGATTAVVAGALGAPKAGIFFAGVGGAALGYYLTSLRFDSAGIIRAHGQVFTLGDMVTIEVPTDYLFDTNTDDFLPGTEPILNSMVSVLERYPSNNIMVSGNTSGNDTDRYELKLALSRARQVSAYLWAHGISNLDATGMKHRKLVYVGYGNYFPIANDIRLKGIRANSRIQITASPTSAMLHMGGCYRVFNNIGAMDEDEVHCPKKTQNDNNPGHPLPGGTDLGREKQHEQNWAPPPATRVTDDYQPKTRETETETANYNKIFSDSQTTAAPSEEPKQGGFKGDDVFKDG